MYFKLGVVISMLCLVFSSTAFAQTDKNQTQTKKSPPGVEAPIPQPTPVAISKGVAKLSPANTKVEFVGIHVGDDPKPRLGGFSNFAGEVKLSDDGKTVSEVWFEFKMDSVWTQIPNLTQHLKQPDFFDVAKHPTSKFESTKFTAGEKPGLMNVTGKLTLHGETQEINFPAMVQVDEKGVVLKSEFKLDRTQFGMKQKTESVAALVALNIAIGEKTTVGGPAEAQPQGQRADGRGMDPAAFFKRMDKNGDGKLVGDEIPERMKQGISRIDTNGDGAVSLEEIQARFKQRGNRGGGGGEE